MNSRLPSSTARSSFPLRVSRAHLSPLLRGVTRDAALRGLSGSTSRETPPLRWWNPHVIDRLQAPLTRYRD